MTDGRLQKWHNDGKSMAARLDHRQAQRKPLHAAVAMGSTSANTQCANINNQTKLVTGYSQEFPNHCTRTAPIAERTEQTATMGTHQARATGLVPNEVRLRELPAKSKSKRRKTKETHRECVADFEEHGPKKH